MRQSSFQTKELIEDDYYSILELSFPAEIEEIKSSYRRLAKVYHPDVFTGTQEEKQESEEKFIKLQKAFDILSSPKQKESYDKLYQDNLEKRQKILRERRKNADEYFNKAVKLYEHGDLDTAITYLQDAINLSPQTAKYHSYLGLIAMKKNWNAYAIAEFKVAISLDPNDAIAGKHAFAILPTTKLQNEEIKKILTGNKKIILKELIKSSNIYALLLLLISIILLSLTISLPWVTIDKITYNGLLTDGKFNIIFAFFILIFTILSVLDKEKSNTWSLGNIIVAPIIIIFLYPNFVSDSYLSNNISMSWLSFLNSAMKFSNIQNGHVVRGIGISLTIISSVLTFTGGILEYLYLTKRKKKP